MYLVRRLKLGENAQLDELAQIAGAKRYPVSEYKPCGRGARGPNPQRWRFVRDRYRAKKSAAIHLAQMLRYKRNVASRTRVNNSLVSS